MGGTSCSPHRKWEFKKKLKMVVPMWTLLFSELQDTCRLSSNPNTMDLVAKTGAKTWRCHQGPGTIGVLGFPFARNDFHFSVPLPTQGALQLVNISKEMADTEDCLYVTLLL
jgi:hypothetical protein